MRFDVGQLPFEGVGNKLTLAFRTNSSILLDLLVCTALSECLFAAHLTSLHGQNIVLIFVLAFTHWRVNIAVLSPTALTH